MFHPRFLGIRTRAKIAQDSITATMPRRGPKRPPRGPQEAPKNPQEAKIGGCPKRFGYFCRRLKTMCFAMVFARWRDRSFHQLHKVVKMQGTFVNFDISMYCVLQMALGLLSPSLLLLLGSFSCIFKTSQNARTIRSKSSQASGWCAKAAKVHFLLQFTSESGPRAQNHRVLYVL